MERKPHLVKWVIICSNKRKKGLRWEIYHPPIEPCFANEVGIMWRKERKGRTFWQKVISGKYGEEDAEWWYQEVRDGCKVGLWKTICKDWDILSSRVAYSMDNEGRVRFWTDKLCGDKSLRTYFPSLFVLTTPKEA